MGTLPTNCQKPQRKGHEHATEYSQQQTGTHVSSFNEKDEPNTLLMFWTSLQICHSLSVYDDSIHITGSKQFQHSKISFIINKGQSEQAKTNKTEREQLRTGQQLSDSGTPPPSPGGPGFDPATKKCENKKYTQRERRGCCIYVEVSPRASLARRAQSALY